MPAEVELGGNPAGAIAQAGNEHAQHPGDAHGLGLFHAFGALRVHGLDGFAGRDIAGKAERIHLNHLALERDGHEEAKQENHADEQGKLPPDELVAGEHGQRGNGGNETGGGNPARGNGHGHDDGVFLHADFILHQTGPAQGFEDGENDNDGGDVHAQAPAGFQTNVQVGKRHQSAKDHAGDDRARGEVPLLVAPIHIFQPLLIAFFG